MIRSSVLLEINELLDRPPEIVNQEFKIITEQKRDSVELIIIYEVGLNESFRAQIPNHREYNNNTHNPDFSISINCNPGEITGVETFTIWGLSNLLKSIDEWVERLIIDLRNTPSFRIYSTQSETINDIQEQIDKIPDEYATNEQITKFEEYLKELEEQLKARIEELEKDSMEKEKQLESLTLEFEILRERLRSTKLRPFLRALVARFYRISSDPKLGVLIDNAKKITNMLSSGSS